MYSLHEYTKHFRNEAEASRCEKFVLLEVASNLAAESYRAEPSIGLLALIYIGRKRHRLYPSIDKAVIRHRGCRIHSSQAALSWMFLTLTRPNCYIIATLAARSIASMAKRHRIVALDNWVKPPELSFEHDRAHYPSTTLDQLPERMKDATIIIVSGTKVTRIGIESASRLQLIAVCIGLHSIML